MAFSSIFERWRRGSRVQDRERSRLLELRFRGHGGGVLRPHRSFRRVHPGLSDFGAAALLVVGASAGWLLALPSVGKLWYLIFHFWIRRLPVTATVFMVPQHWGPHVRFSLPFLDLAAGGITPLAWSLTACASMAAFGGTYLLSEEDLPWSYIVRALVIIQGSALVYFAFASARFPHDLRTYVFGMLAFAVVLIGLVPVILGFTYYVFDFSIWKKIGLTLCCMGHLTLFVPLQYMLQAYLLHHSILFMPLLYFAFGPFLDVLVFVCFYSWGMSWESRAGAAFGSSR